MSALVEVRQAGKTIRPTAERRGRSRRPATERRGPSGRPAVERMRRSGEVASGRHSEAVVIQLRPEATEVRPRPTRAPVRRRVPSAPTRRMTQPIRGRRPMGVRGPEVAHGAPAPLVRRRPGMVPPADLATGVRLTDRGLALAMGLTAILIVAALFCIGATALRVTADPAAATATSAAVAR